jgi:exopolysaccharide biosynthesis polyprenyl glycosylphosphotransferase
MKSSSIAVSEYPGLRKEESRVRPRAVPAAGRQRTRRLHAPATYQPLSLELLRATDTFIAGTVLVAVFLAVNVSTVSDELTEFLLVRASVRNLVFFCAFIALWQTLFTLAGLYDPRAIRGRRAEAKRVAAAAAIGSVAVLAISFVDLRSAFPSIAAGYFFVGTVAMTLGVRGVAREVSARTRSWAVKEILVVGSGPRAYKLLRDLQSVPDSGYHLVGFVDSNDEIELKEIRERMVGRLEDLETLLMRHPIDEVLIALPIRSCYEQIEEVIRTCERVGVESKYFADVFENGFARPHYDRSGDLPAVSLKVVQDDARLLVKRIFDLVAAVLALVALAPVLALVALGIKATSPGPVIFSQWRYGRNRRLFKMYKFRTMVQDAEQLQVDLEHLNEVGGPVFKIADDPRVTRFGRFLRRTSLDELPQLLNVLRGEMSFVGPRPLPTRDVNRFHEGRLMRRFSVMPGLTCLWQINGRNQIDFDEWLRLDLEYIDHWSLWLDFMILLRTLPAVIRGTGAQ